MRPKHLVVILVLVALIVLASPAHAGVVVSVCDESHLLAALAGGGTVTFTCSGTITLTAEITITTDTTIDGSGQAVTISGNHAVRVFTVDSGATLNLNELTVANGSTDAYGGGIFNLYGTLTVNNSTFSGNRASEGGGICSEFGTLTVSNSTFSGNRADNGGGIVNFGEAHISNSTIADNSADRGGGIGNYGRLTVSNNTFSGNRAVNIGDGGGIDNYGMLTVSNSTFSGNSAVNIGGGIYNNYRGRLIVSNSTFSGNHADSYGGGIKNSSIMIVSNSTFSGNSAGAGGNIASNDTLTVRNSIFANSPAGGNCSGTITDGGGNLSYPDTTCPGINSDPMLGRLQNNLGPTETMALGPGSAAIDAGVDATCSASPVNGLDQRSIARPWGTHCDIGAVEQVPLRRLWLPAARAR